MLVSVRLFRNQFSHYLKRVDRRLTVEFVLLFAIFLVFFTEKLIDILNSLLEKPDVSPIGMTIFIEHIVLIPFALTTPFIYTHLLPRQRMLQILRLEAPDPTDAFLILFMHYLKYELAVIIILIPVLGAVLFTLNLLYLIHILITAGISLVLILILMHLCAHYSKGKRIKSYALYFTLFAIYFIVFYCLYLNKNYYSVFQASVMIISLLALLISWSRTWKYWDYNLFRLQIIRHKNYSAAQHRNLYSVFPVGSNIFFALILKEIIGYIRNINFLRIKLTGIALYLIAVIIALQTFTDQKIGALSFLTIIYLWIHYSHQFNEKYVLPETAFFLRTFPFRYIHIWSAKFITEMLFLAPVFIILIAVLLLSGSDYLTTFYLCTMVLLFSIFILATIISVKLLFYDNPRKAGYAYHFMIIFGLLTIYNFYLVGPVIIIFTLLYLSFLSYRQFVR